MNSSLVRSVSGIGLFFSAITVNAGWNKTNEPKDDVTSIAISGDAIYVGTNGDGIFRSTDNGEHWVESNSGMTNFFVSSLAVSDGVIFSGTAGGGAFRSNDAGGNWTATNTGLKNLSVSSFASAGNVLFAGTQGGGLFRSTDTGAHWIVADSLSERATISSIFARDSQIFFGTNGAGVSRSFDSGRSWILSVPPYGKVTALALNGRNVFCGTIDLGSRENVIYLSSNSGVSWKVVNSSTIKSGINCFAVSDSLVFAGTADNGVLFSSDNGVTWDEINHGLTNKDVRALAIKNKTIFAATSGGGVWQLPLSEATGPASSQRKGEAPNQSMVRMNARNLSNHTLNVELFLSHSEKALAQIHDLSGREAATLRWMNLGAGSHSLTFDTRNLHSGLYRLSVQLGSTKYVESIPFFR